MGEFTIRIAQTVFEVSSLFESTRDYLGKYLTEESPAFSVSVTPEERAAEQGLLDEEADREGLRRRKFTEPFLERAVIQRKIAGILLHRNILLLHGSTVAVDGRGYLFTAASGVGKSTHTRLWRELLGDRAVMVNDDRAFLELHPEGILAYGSPWSGKHGLDSNICVPLAGICILERGPENRIIPTTPEECLPFLLAQAFLPADGQEAVLQALTAALSHRVPLWRMACTKSPAAAQMAYAAMGEER